MRERNVGMNPLEPESFQGQLTKKWRSDCEWMNRRAKIMDKPRQCQLGGGTRSAADAGICFQHENRATGARQRDGCGETVRTAPDNDRVEFSVALLDWQCHRRSKTRSPAARNHWVVCETNHEMSKVQVYGCNHVAIEVGDIEKAVAFYEDVFNLEKLDTGEGDAFFKLGEHQFLALFETRKIRPSGEHHFGIMVRDEEQLAEVRKKLTGKY